MKIKRFFAICVFALCTAFALQTAVGAEEEVSNKPRTIVTNDGEVDDMDSMIRLMLYSNEMEIEGIILTSSQYHWAGDSDEGGIDGFSWPGTKWMDDILDGYEAVYPNLIRHADGYSTPEYLRSINVVGNVKYKGEMDEDTQGSDLIKNCLLDTTDSRPVYIQTWGGTNTMARALKSIEEEYKNTAQWAEIQQRVYDKAIIYIILDQDETYKNYIRSAWPNLKILKDPGNFWTFAYSWSGSDVPSEIQQKFKGAFMEKNIKFNHGKLLEGYYTWGDGHTIPNVTYGFQHGWERVFLSKCKGGRYSFISEGDSPSYFYLIDNGLRSMEDPTYGGWGGRFAATNGTETVANVTDYNPYSNTWRSQYTLVRWYKDIQADFAARADWCVADEYSGANHRPTLTVAEGVDITAEPGEVITLNSSATDSDNDTLYYKWWQYYEADTYGGNEGQIALTGADTQTVSFTVPTDATSGQTIHIIAEVRDGNENERDNYMTHYQRVIVTVK